MPAPGGGNGAGDGRATLARGGTAKMAAAAVPGAAGGAMPFGYTLGAGGEPGAGPSPSRPALSSRQGPAPARQPPPSAADGVGPPLGSAGTGAAASAAPAGKGAATSTVSSTASCGGSAEGAGTAATGTGNACGTGGGRGSPAARPTCPRAAASAASPLEPAEAQVCTLRVVRVRGYPRRRRLQGRRARAPAAPAAAAAAAARSALHGAPHGGADLLLAAAEDVRQRGGQRGQVAADSLSLARVVSLMRDSMTLRCSRQRGSIRLTRMCPAMSPTATSSPVSGEVTSCGVGAAAARVHANIVAHDAHLCLFLRLLHVHVGGRAVVAAGVAAAPASPPPAAAPAACATSARSSASMGSLLVHGRRALPPRPPPARPRPLGQPPRPAARRTTSRSSMGAQPPSRPRRSSMAPTTTKSCQPTDCAAARSASSARRRGARRRVARALPPSRRSARSSTRARESGVGRQFGGQAPWRHQHRGVGVAEGGEEGEERVRGLEEVELGRGVLTRGKLGEELFAVARHRCRCQLDHVQVQGGEAPRAHAIVYTAGAARGWVGASTEGAAGWAPARRPAPRPGWGSGCAGRSRGLSSRGGMLRQLVLVVGMVGVPGLQEAELGVLSLVGAHPALEVGACRVEGGV